MEARELGPRNVPWARDNSGSVDDHLREAAAPGRTEAQLAPFLTPQGTSALRPPPSPVTVQTSHHPSPWPRAESKHLRGRSARLSPAAAGDNMARDSRAHGPRPWAQLLLPVTVTLRKT